jgi:hypothetical protein
MEEGNMAEPPVPDQVRTQAAGGQGPTTPNLLESSNGASDTALRASHASDSQASEGEGSGLGRVVQLLEALLTQSPDKCRAQMTSDQGAERVEGESQLVFTERTFTLSRSVFHTQYQCLLWITVAK